MFNKPITTIAAALPLLVAAGCGDPELGEADGELGTETEEVLGGTATLLHPEVIQLLKPDPDTGAAKPWCSATLITPSFFVTAAHCTDDGINQVRIEDTAGIRQTRTIARLVPLTPLPPSGQASSSDIAIGQLTSNVPLFWPQARLVTVPAAGSTVTILGYGCTRAGGTDLGTKRFRTGPRDSAFSCDGDSGGTWIRGTIDDPPFLYGVTSGTRTYSPIASLSPMIFGLIRGQQNGFEIGVDRPGTDVVSFGSPTPNACKLACEQNSGCMSFTYNRSDGLCHLKSGTPSPIESNANVASGLPQGMGSFDVPGSDARIVTRASADLCRVECARDRNCLAYTWVTQSQNCFIKNTRPAVRPCPSGLTCTSGVRRIAPPPPPPIPVNCGPGQAPCPQTFPPHWDGNLDWGTDRLGGDLRQEFSGSYQACADACDLDNQCKSWTFSSHAQTGGTIPICYLKSSDAAPTNSSANFGLISGQKGRRNF